jgi:hypothetical protein
VGLGRLCIIISIINGDTNVEAGRHMTGVYATNAAREALSPMYVFDSGAKLEQNFRVKTTWLDGLPVITGRFGCPELIEESRLLCEISKLDG